MIEFKMTKGFDGPRGILAVSEKYGELYFNKRQAQAGIATLYFTRKLSIQDANTVIIEINKSTLPGEDIPLIKS